MKYTKYKPFHIFINGLNIWFKPVFEMDFVAAFFPNLSTSIAPVRKIHIPKSLASAKTKQVFGVLSKIKLRVYAQNANFLPRAPSGCKGIYTGEKGEGNRVANPSVDRDVLEIAAKNFSNLWLANGNLPALCST